jgi:hypothetical protein
MFSNTKLKRCPVTNIGVTFTLTGNLLGKDALVEIFNNLKTVTSKTITITSNPGVTLLTIEDKAIATNKGWTLVL